MLIVSDTSPITNLIRINKLDLLKQLYSEVVIPEKVQDELINYENQKEEIDKRDWIFVRTVSNSDEVRKLEEELDAGEAEAIVLAKELDADILIIDERKGRKIAEENGLKIIGLLGVLIKAKQMGYIEELKPLLNELINNVGFRVSRGLYNRILTEVNE